MPAYERGRGLVSGPQPLAPNQLWNARPKADAWGIVGPGFAQGITSAAGALMANTTFAPLVTDGENLILTFAFASERRVLTKVDPTGRILWARTVNDAHLTGTPGAQLAVDPQGNIALAYLSADGANCRLSLFSPNGALLWSRFCTVTARPAQPVCFGPDGSIYWAPSLSVLKIGRSGEIVAQTLLTFASLGDPYGIAADASGVYVTGEYGAQDGFAVKLNLGLSSVTWGRQFVLTGSGISRGRQVILLPDGGVVLYLAGRDTGAVNNYYWLRRIDPAAGTNIWTAEAVAADNHGPASYHQPSGGIVLGGTVTGNTARIVAFNVTSGEYAWGLRQQHNSAHWYGAACTPSGALYTLHSRGTSRSYSIERLRPGRTAALGGVNSTGDLRFPTSEAAALPAIASSPPNASAAITLSASSLTLTVADMPNEPYAFPRLEVCPL